MKKIKILVMAMLISLTAFANIYGEEFADVKGHWAERYINDVVSKGLAKGYEQGNFIPDNPTTRIEAVIFAANMYPDSTITSVYEASKSKWIDKLRKNQIPVWADKYMVFGLEKKIFPETFLKHFVDQKNPNRQNFSLRYEFITFMVNALGFKNEFISNPKLSFTDAATINDQVVPYIDVMVRKGIIVGTGKFNPTDRLTRAQVSVILSNSYKYSEKAKGGVGETLPDASKNELVGKVMSMTMSNTKATIQIQTSDGKIGIYTAEEGKTSIVNGTETKKLSDIKIGQNISFIAKDSVIMSIKINKVPEISKLTLSGKFVSYSSLELVMAVNGETKTFEINPGLEFTKGTKKIKAIDLKVGDEITVEVQNKIIISGSVKAVNKTIDGTIGKVNGKEITINEPTGSFPYIVPDNVEIFVDQKKVNTLSELVIGDMVTAKVVNSEIESMDVVTTKRTIRNVIVTGIAQGNSGPVITFKDSDSNIFTKIANKDTEFIVKGKQKSISDISLAYESDIIVKGHKLLTLETQGEFKLIKIIGVVNKVDLKNKILTVSDADNKSYVVNIESNTMITGFNSNEEKTLKNVFENDNIVVEGTDNNSFVMAQKIIFWK